MVFGVFFIQMFFFLHHQPGSITMATGTHCCMSVTIHSLDAIVSSEAI